MDQALMIIAAGIVLFLVWQNFFANGKLKATPEKLEEGEVNATDVSGEQPYFKEDEVHTNETELVEPHGTLCDNGEAKPLEKQPFCSRSYCLACDVTCDEQETDDIRRNYTELITVLREKRNDEYPFYKMGMVVSN